MRSYIASTIALLLIGPVMPVWGDNGEERGQTATQQATEQQVQKWIGQLDADAFVVRENAMQRLIKAQIVAIEPIKKALAGNSLEVTTRGIHILQELALSDDMTTELAARAALEEIAEARVTSAARRAVTTLEALNNLRQSRSVDRLEKLGAKFEMTPVQAGFQFVETLDKVVIGDDWKGKDEDLRSLEWLHDMRPGPDTRTSIPSDSRRQRSREETTGSRFRSSCNSARSSSRWARMASSSSGGTALRGLKRTRPPSAHTTTPRLFSSARSALTLIPRPPRNLERAPRRVQVCLRPGIPPSQPEHPSQAGFH